jgi:hypothetical protein
MAPARNLIVDENLTRKGAGRPKGSPNKLGKAAKDAIAEAADKLGGVDRLVQWAQEAPENERAFWSSIYPKLIPVTLSGDSENPIQTISRIELVALSDDS